MQLADFPRFRLGHFPTPLEFLPRLTQALGGPRIYIKRDDCSGLASGGNKTRKLEFLVAEALARGADTLLTVGALQSNHARQTAAAAARAGLQCTVLLERRVQGQGPEYEVSGNALLNQLLGARTLSFEAGTDMAHAMEQTAKDLAREGARPYLISGGGSNPVGSLGYIRCAQELLSQASEQDIHIDGIVHPTGSCGTQAGLVIGLAASHSEIPVLGMSVRMPQADLENKVWALVQDTVDYLALPDSVVAREQITVDAGHVGEGYGIPSPATLDAIRLCAQTEGILLDPVYTGKAMAGLMARVRAGRYRSDENIVFLHTGGAAALFAYASSFGAEARGQ